jgi:hypothetical protein
MSSLSLFGALRAIQEINHWRSCDAFIHDSYVLEYSNSEEENLEFYIGRTHCVPANSQMAVDCYLLSSQYNGHYVVELKAAGLVLIVVWNAMDTTWLS